MKRFLTKADNASKRVRRRPPAVLSEYQLMRFAIVALLSSNPSSTSLFLSIVGEFGGKVDRCFGGKSFAASKNIGGLKWVAPRAMAGQVLSNVMNDEASETSWFI